MNQNEMMFNIKYTHNFYVKKCSRLFSLHTIKRKSFFSNAVSMKHISMETQF